MKNKTIRMSESKLKQLIENTVKSVITEKHRPSGLPKGTKREFIRNANGKKETFYKVPSLQQYIDKNGGYQGIASKHQRINARQVDNPEGEYLDTTLADGTKEVQGRHVPQGHWVVNNVGNAESYAIDPKTFGKRYVQDGDNEGVYRPKGNPMKVSHAFKHNVSFPVPQWGKGSVQRIKKGGYGLQDVTNPKDTYGNAEQEFKASYDFDEMFGESTNRSSVRLTESKLKSLIAEAVNEVLYEMVNEGQGASELWDRIDNSLSGTGYRNASYSKQRNRRGASLKNYIKTGSWLGNEDNDLIGYRGYSGDAVHKDKSKNASDWDLDAYDIKPINNSIRGKMGRAVAGTALRLMSPGRTIDRIGNQIMNKIRPKT